MNLNQYRDLLRGQGLADSTVQDYCGYIRRLTIWCQQHSHDPATIAPHHVRTWADTLANSWSTRKQARVACRHYWSHRFDRPWEAIRVPNRPDPRYYGLTPTQAATLKAAAVMYGSRPGLATLCCLYTGARASEVAGFHHGHIGDGMIRWWRTKTGGGWHAMPLHPVLAEALGEGSGHVFVGNNGRPHVSGQTVWAWVVKVSETVGMRVTPKQLRSTAGMMVMESTGDLDAAASFLGHRDVNVTRNVYIAKTSGQRMAAAVGALDYDTQ